jgi:superfamily II DNA or RNA helicase
VLRPYQLAPIEGLEDGDLIVSPTGTGKSVILAEIARREVDAGGLALAVAHRTELLGQLSNKFRDAWLTPELNVLVRSIQELRLAPPIPGVTMLLWDEAHHAAGDDWMRLRTEQYPRAKLVGFTATPERGDGRGMGSAGFRRIRTTISVKEAVAAGYLVKPDVIRPSRALAPGELAQDPLDAYLEHARGTRAISFHPNVQLAIEAACKFREHVPAAAVWGDMPSKDRVAVLQRFARGELLVLTSVNVLTEGFDVPETETCILARRFGTRGALVQAGGRVLRPAPGKTRGLILDLCGVTHDLGELDDDVTYHLEGRGIRRPSDEIDVRFCPVCGAPVVGKECDQCGHAGEMKLRRPRVLGLPMERFARVRQDDDDARAARLSRWLGECRAKGWKEGRALHRFKGAYGDWPSRELVTRARSLTSG